MFYNIITFEKDFFLIQAVGFLYPWTSLVVLRPASIALISLGFAEYVTAPFYPGCETPLNIRKCAAAFCIS